VTKDEKKTWTKCIEGRILLKTGSEVGSLDLIYKKCTNDAKYFKGKYNKSNTLSFMLKKKN